jgi:hypothetical protein
MRWTGHALASLFLLWAAASPAAAARPYVFHMGLGYSASLDEGAPGGSIGFSAGFFHRLERSPQLAVGAEVGYLDLGDTGLGGVGLYTSRIRFSNGFHDHEWMRYAFYTRSEANPGLLFGGGLLFGRRADALRFGLDARFHFIDTDLEPTTLLALMGRLYF